MNNNLKIGIVIPTMNRADFVIRQIQYYASVNCPHTIYLCDSSGQEDYEKIKNEVDKLKDKINIIFEYLPNFTRGTADTVKHLLPMVKEKYVCYSCDDDYQIPNSLTVCAEFLENNPDYATASGYAISFRLNSNGVYGDLDRVSDCPIPDISDESAADRLLHFFSDNFVPLFYVNRTDQFIKSHEHVSQVGDHMIGSEFLPSALSIIAGKSKTLDCLGYIRQMHDKHRPQLTSLSLLKWICNSDWNDSYKIFENVVSEAISVKDNIPVEDAAKIADQAFTLQLLKWLKGRKNHKHIIPTNNYFYEKFLKPVRSKIARAFPFVKYVYRVQIKQKLNGRKEIHYEVSRPGSQYYNDFKPIMDSFTGKIKTYL